MFGPVQTGKNMFFDASLDVIRLLFRLDENARNLEEIVTSCVALGSELALLRCYLFVQ